MTVKELVKKVSKDYQMSEEELLRKSIKEFLVRQKQEIETDILHILATHQVKNIRELEKIVAQKTEHPVWEDLIVLENLQAKLKEIRHDLKTLWERDLQV